MGGRTDGWIDIRMEAIGRDGQRKDTLVVLNRYNGLALLDIFK